MFCTRPVGFAVSPLAPVKLAQDTPAPNVPAVAVAVQVPPKPAPLDEVKITVIIVVRPD